MGIGGIRSNSAHFSGSEGRGIPRHCLLREKSKKPQLWARLRGSTWLLASVKSRPWNRPSMGREWEWTRTSRSRINKSCCCLPFHLSSAARSRPESYEISSPRNDLVSRGVRRQPPPPPSSPRVLLSCFSRGSTWIELKLVALYETKTREELLGRLFRI